VDAWTRATRARERDVDRAREDSIARARNTLAR